MSSEAEDWYEPDPIDYMWGVGFWPNGVYVVQQGPYDDAEVWGEYRTLDRAERIARRLNRAQWQYPDLTE